jgi:ligand-binding sensor domain-containing protein
MHNCTTPLISLFVLAGSLSAQSNEWRHFRPGNTGVAGDEHTFLSEDQFGNIWTNGRVLNFTTESSVVRFNHEDTIFTCWSDKDGYLDGDIVNEAEVDENGILWVATTGGLTQFDGVDWYTYDMSNTELPSENIRSVAFDSEGSVWVAFQEVNLTIGGIAKFNGTNWLIYTPENSSLPSYLCDDVLIGNNNEVIIQNEFSVTFFDGINFMNYDYQNSPIGGIQISDVTLDELGNAYIVSQGSWSSEIAIFDGSNWEVWDNSNTPILSEYWVNKIEIKGEQKLLSGYSGMTDVIIDWNGPDYTVYTAYDNIFDIHIDSNGELWACGLSSVSHLTEEGWKDFSRYSAGLSENHNENIFIDSFGRLWVANGNGGIHIYDCPHWESYGPWNQGLYPSPQSLSTVGAAICEDSYGNIWFAFNSTSGTVVKIPGGDYKNYDAWQVFDGTNSPVSWLEECEADGFGNVFFYSDYGVYMYNNDTEDWVTWTVENCELLNYTDGLGKDNEGKIYFGGWQQVAIYDNGLWSAIHFPDIGADISVVNDIAFDDDNTMWIASDNGLWHWDGSNWTNWNMLNSGIVADHITSVAFSPEGTLWVSGFTYDGFLTGGVSRFNYLDGTWTTFTSTNSDLQGEQIDDITFDQSGNLWINAYPWGIDVYRDGGTIGFECIDQSLEEISTGIKEHASNTSSHNISVYPNPTSDHLTLQTTSEVSAQLTVSLLDDKATTITHFGTFNLVSGDNLIQLNVEKLSPGLYIIYLCSDTCQQRIRFVKN